MVLCTEERRFTTNEFSVIVKQRKSEQIVRTRYILMVQLYLHPSQSSPNARERLRLNGRGRGVVVLVYVRVLSRGNSVEQLDKAFIDGVRLDVLEVPLLPRRASRLLVPPPLPLFVLHNTTHQTSNVMLMGTPPRGDDDEGRTSILLFSRLADS